MIFAADIVLPITSAPLQNAAVLVNEGRIIALGDKDMIIAENPGEEVLDFGASILMPGLVNLHGHIECSSFDFLAEQGPFNTWLGGIIKASRAMQREDWLAAARLGVQRYLEAGITCTADITRSGLGLQAIAEVKMPAVVYIEAVGVDESNLATVVVDLLEQIKSGMQIADLGGFKLGLSPHSSYTLSTAALKLCASIARENNLPLTMHVAETQGELELITNGTGHLAEVISTRLNLDVIEQGGTGVTPVRFLNDMDLVTDSLIAAHGVWLTDEDIVLLREKNAAISVCPTSNELLEVGEAPINKFLEYGLKFGIGTDSAASNPDLDLFVEARKVLRILDKQTGGNATDDSATIDIVMTENPQAPALLPKIQSDKLIETITINAAGLLGLSDDLGSIEPGKRADFIAVDYNPIIHSDPYDYLVTLASKSLINHTILAGDVHYKRD